jgi:hypothetical protein
MNELRGTEMIKNIKQINYYTLLRKLHLKESKVYCIVKCVETNNESHNLWRLLCAPPPCCSKNALTL